MHPDAAPHDSTRPSLWERAENLFVLFILAVMVLLPLVGVSVRWITGEGLAGANTWVQGLNLWVACIGGGLAARSNRHLALSTGTFLKLTERGRDLLAAFTSSVATACAAWLAWGSVQLVLAERHSSVTLWGGVPSWVNQVAMPVGFGIMAFRFAFRGNRTWWGRVAALVSVACAGALAAVPASDRGVLVMAGVGLILAAMAFGAPLFTTLGGITMLLFVGAPVPVSIAAVPAETYTIVASPMLPSLPLFSVAGYLLAEGGASKRLVRLIQAWFGWLPGGSAIAAIVVCAFFTTFTGASGVTILALGGLLLPILEAAGYTRKYAIGLLTASGSLGLLFPPSLPVILYGVASHVSIKDLFLGGLIPGLLLMVLLIGMSVVRAMMDRAPRSAFVGREAWASLWAAKWEVALPVLVVGSIFGGFMTLMESAAWTAAYAILSEVVVHRDLHIRRDVPRIVVECATLMGAVLVILGMALGFTNYLVDAEIPMKLTAWVQAHVASKVAFILVLNVVLLWVGSLMEVYSAIMVVVPLLVPIANAFGIAPVHLGILFLANLELGYLTPPVGLNLFLSSFRFKEPLVAVYRHAVPFLVVLGLGVLFISYVPAITVWAEGDTAGVEEDFNRQVQEQDPVLEPAPEAPAAPLVPGLDLQKELGMEPPAGGEPTPGADPALEPAPAAPAPLVPGLDPATLMKELEAAQPAE